MHNGQSQTSNTTFRSLVLINTLAIILSGCTTTQRSATAKASNNIPPAATQASASTHGFSSRDEWIESRGVEIPVTLVTPSTPRDTTPLVILIHGHGGTRHEAGGFTAVAQGLANQGIASVRMDFPGCGDSKESFTQNNLSNMLQDIAAARRYAEAQITVDPQRRGLLGFSMGGRLAIKLATTTPDYRALALWAPSAIDGAATMNHYLGGVQAYQRMKQQAIDEGFAPFTTFWGQKQQLGPRWFTDIEQSTPGSDIRRYQGALFVLYGDQDTVIEPRISEQLISNARLAQPIVRHIVEGADHGLGFFNNDTVSSNQTINQTVAFLTEQLLRAN